MGKSEIIHKIVSVNFVMDVSERIKYIVSKMKEKELSKEEEYLFKFNIGI